MFTWSKGTVNKDTQTKKATYTTEMRYKTSAISVVTLIQLNKLKEHNYEK